MAPKPPRRCRRLALVSIALLAAVARGVRFAASAAAELAAVKASSSASVKFNPQPFFVGGVLRLLGGSLPTEPVRFGGIHRAGDALDRTPSPLLTQVLTQEVTPGKSVVASLFPWDLVPETVINKITMRGKVWKARMTTADGDERMVAMKQIDVTKRSRTSAMREAEILELFSGGPFPEYLGWWGARDSVLLVMELMDGDMSFIVQRASFEEVALLDRLRLVMDLLDGLQRLDEAGFVHRGICPDNLLVKQVGGETRLKIGDFSAAFSSGGRPVFRRHLRERKVGGGGENTYTRWAPENFHDRYTHKSDVYAAGLVLYPLLFEGMTTWPNIVGEETAKRASKNFTAYMHRWHDYNVSEDKIIAKAQEFAQNSGNEFLHALLALLKGMLAHDEAERYDAAGAAKALKALLDMPRDPRTTQELMRQAVAQWIATEVKPGKSIVRKNTFGDRSLTTNLIPERMLGCGTTGAIWQARLIEEGIEHEVAMKVIDRRTGARPSQLKREARIMQHFSGGPFLKFRTQQDTGLRSLLITELAIGDLQRMVLDRPMQAVGVAERLRFLRELLEGVQAMEDDGFVHRDIQPTNLLFTILDGRWHLKIADFGAAYKPDGDKDFVLLPDEMADPAGNYTFWAPECWDNEYSHKSDMYAVGIVFYQMLFGGELPEALRVDPEEAFSAGRRPEKFEQRFRNFEVSNDRLFVATRTLARERQDLWMLGVLALLEGMLAPDRAIRSSAAQAIRALDALGPVDRWRGSVEPFVRHDRSELLLREARESVEGPQHTPT